MKWVSIETRDWSILRACSLLLQKRLQNPSEKMGIWEWMGSTAEAVKRNVPDVRPLLNATKTCGSKIDQAVRVHGLNRIYQMMPADQIKSIIYCYTTKFAKNAAIYALHQGYKLIPLNYLQFSSMYDVATVQISPVPVRRMLEP